jgi:hypothetical protein
LINSPNLWYYRTMERIYPDGVVQLAAYRGRSNASFGEARRQELEHRAQQGLLDEAPLTNRPGVSTFVDLSAPGKRVVHIAVLTD